ncbi:MAG: ribonuclease E/G [Rhodospirillaceae bacterium]|nr:ribonuclease E/G [Rhodospirillaceae bacterium]
MTKRMLIDATQTEEIRVVVTSGNRVEDFDFEVASRRPLKGNIYLAQVTRVEPSLQAAFVEYGGNRHGFLAFSEIHADYYRIPMEDREALLAEQAAETTFSSDESEPGSNSDVESEVATINNDDANELIKDNSPNTNDDKNEQLPSNTKKRRYKIQEVIARRQIMLIQVVKEERGNKGAALTTFLSLAGRYCVLMPNTPKGGGVSRKIISALDRKRLKGVVEGLNVPEGMAVIVRTAGSQRTKTEIKRDYEYLVRLWDQIRESTLVSTAPYLVHEEGNIIKRSIRDLYTRDIDEILVEGESGYRLAKDFMKTLMPSHARRVQTFASGGIPLFSRFQIENQLDSLYEPVVQLKSGGYLVLNQTEALVAVDVNSGRSTRERNIEETALKTNLEAAEEVARQLRLRDLAGLVVIDFIDMYESRNQHAVERKVKDVIKSDRARIQLSRISQFGLMELSRQRLRPSVTEASTQPCPHCAGSGLRRSIDSAALQVLRNIEEEGLKQEAKEIVVKLTPEVGFYILNRKRDTLNGMEQRYEFQITLEPDEKLLGAEHKIERIIKKIAEDKVVDIVDTAQKVIDANNSSNNAENNQDDSESLSQKVRQRKRRAYKRKTTHEEKTEEPKEQKLVSLENPNESLKTDDTEDDDGAKRRRRRGKRGGRRRTRKVTEEENFQQEDNKDASNLLLPESSPPLSVVPPAVIEERAGSEVPNNDKKTAPKSGSTKNQKPKPVRTVKQAVDEDRSTKKSAKKPVRKNRKDTPVLKDDTNSSTITDHDANISEPQKLSRAPAKPPKVETEKPKTEAPRQGWWNRLIK